MITYLSNYASHKVAFFAATGVLALALAAPAAAATITQWDFNGALGVNNAPAPSLGAGSATPVGMTNGANNADILAAGGPPFSSDPAATNRAWRIRGSVSNGWSGTTSLLSGARFNASTAGYNDIVVSLDMTATDGSPRHGQFQYTLDGTNFVSFGSIIDFNVGNDEWVNGRTWDLSSVAGANNNPLFGFKVVSAFSPAAFTNANGLQAANTAFQRADTETGVYTGGAGNWRFDMVTFSGTAVPEPTALVLMAGSLGFVAVAQRRRNG
jgi:hypothetical protein